MAQLLEQLIDRHLETRQAAETRPMRKLHPSTIGMCQRRIVFDIMMVPQKPIEPGLIRIFNNGHSMHERYEKLFSDMGILVQAEMKIELGEISGHTDALVNIPSFLNPEGVLYLIELKSAMSRSFKPMAENNRPKTEHRAQLMFYMHLSGVHKGILYVENKDTQEIWEYHMNYDPDYGQRLMNKAEQSIQMAKDRMLPPMEKGYTPSCYKCSICPFNLYCHAGDIKRNGEERFPNPFEQGSEAHADTESVIQAMRENRAIPHVIQGNTNGDLIREVFEKNKIFSNKVDETLCT